MDSLFTRYPYIEKLVINRCVDPMSKYRATQWEGGELVDQLSRRDSSTNLYGVYKELEHIADYEGKIQAHLCALMKKQQLLDNRTLIYDITSTFFERTTCTLAFKGYSRDHRPDKVQIVIAMAVTSEGYPFYWKVYQGNTPDISTVKDFTDRIIRLFGMNDFVLVFDRGMVSDANIAYIEEKQYRFISAVDKNEIQTSTPVDLQQFQGVDEGNVHERLEGFLQYDASLWYREYQQETHRYIIGFNTKKQRDDRAIRQRKLNRFEKSITELNQQLSQAKRNRNKSTVTQSLNALLKKYKLTRIIHATVEDLPIPKPKGYVESFRVSYAVDRHELQMAMLFDGLTCFHTNTAVTDFSAANVILQYRDKNVVEEGFHEIKGLIELRPIYLSVKKRVCAHVTVCILAYLLWNTLEKRVSRKINLSVADLLSELAKCKSNSLTDTSDNERFFTLTRFTAAQRNILNYLGYSTFAVEKCFRNLTPLPD